MSVDVKIAPSWKSKLESEFEKPYFDQLIGFVKQEYLTSTVSRLVGTPFKIYENRGMSSSSYGFGPTGGANEYEYTVLAAGLLNEDFALDVLMVGDGGTYVLLGNGAVPPTLAPIQLTTTKWAAAVVMDIDADTDTEIVATTGAGDVDIWEENL